MKNNWVRCKPFRISEEVFHLKYIFEEKQKTRKEIEAIFL